MLYTGDSVCTKVHQPFLPSAHSLCVINLTSLITPKKQLFPVKMWAQQSHPTPSAKPSNSFPCVHPIRLFSSPSLLSPPPTHDTAVSCPHKSTAAPFLSHFSMQLIGAVARSSDNCFVWSAPDLQLSIICLRALKREILSLLPLGK